MGRKAALRRWITRIVVAALAIAWLTAAGVYLKSRGHIERQHDPELRQLVTVTDAASVAEGERLARVYGCFDACHGDRMQGTVLSQHPLNGRIVAPNITRSVRRLTLPEIEAVVRQGVKPDGTSVFGMPSSSFAAMADRDLANIVGFIQQYPQQNETPGRSEYGLLTRYHMLSGALPPQAEIDFLVPWRETFRNNEVRLGEYLATVACSQCHGLDLEGGPGGAPSLEKVRSYNRFEFADLLTQGFAPGQREVGRMSDTARTRFVHLTDDEIEALFVYLKTRD